MNLTAVVETQFIQNNLTTQKFCFLQFKKNQTLPVTLLQ